ncbi:hypothetical protein D3C81_1706250 [compost metagenome]
MPNLLISSCRTIKSSASRSSCFALSCPPICSKVSFARPRFLRFRSPAAPIVIPPLRILIAVNNAPNSTIATTSGTTLTPVTAKNTIRTGINPMAASIIHLRIRPCPHSFRCTRQNNKFTVLTVRQSNIDVFLVHFRCSRQFVVFLFHLL